MCAEDFAVQPIAFDVGEDFVVEADLVQVAAAVIQVVDLSAVGQNGGGTDEVAVQVVLVNGFLNLVVLAGKGVD